MAGSKGGRRRIGSDRVSRRRAPGSVPDRMTPRQELFVEHYLADPEFNGERAALKAGYSPKTAKTMASLNLRKPHIAEAIRAALAKRAERIEITQDMVVRELAAIAFSDPRRFFDADGTLKAPKDWDDVTAAALSAIENEEIYEGRGEAREHIGTTRKVKRWDKVKALELLGRHLGMWNDKLQLGNTGGGPLQIEIVQFGGEG